LIPSPPNKYMNKLINIISEKIILLNDTILRSMMEKDKISIIKDFTETGIKILEADFGFAWWKFMKDEKYKLAYKSPTTPYNPTYPREKGGNYIAIKTKKPFFDSNVKKVKYRHDISRYLKSYIIIPIFYRKNTYGSFVLCYKKKHIFTKDELSLAHTMGNAAAQAITIYRLVESEKQALLLAEKQKETQLLLDQEKIKTEFIANATHEFRTPLAIMRGNVDLALSSKNGGKIKSAEAALRAVRGEIAHLSAILSDLSDLTSSRGHHVKEELREPINIEKLLDKIAKRLKALTHRKKISFKIKKSVKKEESTILGNKEKLEKLFLNLIRNAIIYGKEKGRVVIHIKKNKENLVIKVADDGVGIPKEELPYIFERFYRTKAARMMTPIGTGLGLAIVKQSVEAHKGTIEAESKEGAGSTFTVSLPLHRSD